jgi:predicted house-cleaning noncanonical NTP pyrophosphatase (MazG superfamily)
MGTEEIPTDGEQENGGKLVRDRSPEILRAAGLQPVVTLLNEAAYHRALRRKLLEEAREAAEADDTALLDELADLHELVAVLARIAGASLEDVATQAQRKRAARGGFNQRLWLAGIPG